MAFSVDLSPRCRRKLVPDSGKQVDELGEVSAQQSITGGDTNTLVIEENIIDPVVPIYFGAGAGQGSGKLFARSISHCYG